MIHTIVLALGAFLAGFLFARAIYRSVQIESWQVSVSSDLKGKAEIFATDSSISLRLKSEPSSEEDNQEIERYHVRAWQKLQV